MDAKLTLKLDKDVIAQAKVYARDHQESLSSLVERYFRVLIDQSSWADHEEISSTVRELSGIIRLDEVDDGREAYTDYLLEKYS
jgi:hypothetical protein